MISHNIVAWWAAQALWVRMPLTIGFAVLIACWLLVAWEYRPRRRPAARATRGWVGATENWSPKAETVQAGLADDVTAEAVEHARDIEAVVRVEVAERLDLEQRRAELTLAESRTDFEMAAIDLDRRLGAVLARFDAAMARGRSAWPDTAQWPVVVPTAPRPVRPATGKRARRDRKRLNQGKAVMA